MLRNLPSRLFASRPAYEPVEDDELLADPDREEDVQDTPQLDESPRRQFSWRDYAGFLLLGITMLWAWWVLHQPFTYLHQAI